MKLHVRFSFLTALALGLVAMSHAASAQSDTFSWQNITYAPSPNAAATTTVLGNSTGNTNTLSVKLVLSNNATFYTGVQSPASAANSDNANIYATSGIATQRSLQVAVHDTTNADFTTVTIFFANPVTNLNFKLFDVDSGTVNGGGYVDLIRNIQGMPSGGGAAIGPQNVTGGTANSVSGSGLTAQVLGTMTNAQTASGGDVSVSFGSTPVSQFSFVYGDNYTIPNGGSHSVVQIVALSDLSFTTVPEPGSLAVMGVGMFGLGTLTMLRRRKRQS